MDNYDEIEFNNFINNDGMIKEITKIRVVVRKRTSNKKEIQRGDIDIIDIRSSQTLVVKELK
jgi:hypothetical protein